MTDTGFRAAASHIFSALALGGTIEDEIGKHYMEEMHPIEVEAIRRAIKAAPAFAKGINRVGPKTRQMIARKAFDLAVYLRDDPFWLQP